MKLLAPWIAVSAALQAVRGLQCLPSRSCPSTATQKYMCVGYTDVSGSTRLLCDGVHTKVSTCRDYYRGRGGSNIICCDTDNCMQNSLYDASARLLHPGKKNDAVGKAALPLAAGSASTAAKPKPAHKLLNCYLNGPEPNAFIKSSDLGPEGCSDANFCASYNLDGKQWYQCINYPDRPAADCQAYFGRLGASNVRCCNTDYCNQPAVQRSAPPPAVRNGNAAAQPASLIALTAAAAAILFI